MRRVAATLVLVALLAGGCGESDDGARVPDRAVLTIYTSLPMHGDSARVAESVAAAQRLALQDRGGKAAGRRIKLLELDSSKPDGHSWDPSVVEQNAKRAADDESTIAYIGELDLGGSAVSVPVTNDKGILQVSPYDGMTNLTRLQPGGPPTGPERFYPDGERTFARLVPTDLAQAAVLVDWARAGGAEKVAILHDNQVHGRTVSAQLVYMADLRKLTVSAVDEVDLTQKPEKYAEVAADLAEDAEKRPDAVIYAGLADETAEPLLAALDDALPGVELYASSGVAVEPFTDAGAPNVRFTEPARPLDEYPAPARRLHARLERALGGDVPVEALYGYESMRLVLDAIEHAGPRAGDRAAVVKEALRGDPGGPLGPLELTPEGDVADQRVATYERTAAGLAYRGLREPQLPPPAKTEAEESK